MHEAAAKHARSWQVQTPCQHSVCWTCTDLLYVVLAAGNNPCNHTRPETQGFQHVSALYDVFPEKCASTEEAMAKPAHDSGIQKNTVKPAQNSAQPECHGGTCTGQCAPCRTWPSLWDTAHPESNVKNCAGQCAYRKPVKPVQDSAHPERHSQTCRAVPSITTCAFRRVE